MCAHRFPLSSHQRQGNQMLPQFASYLILLTLIYLHLVTLFVQSDLYSMQNMRVWLRLFKIMLFNVSLILKYSCLHFSFISIYVLSSGGGQKRPFLVIHLFKFHLSCYFFLFQGYLFCMVCSAVGTWAPQLIPLFSAGTLREMNCMYLDI